MEEENPLSNEIILNTGAQQACFYFYFLISNTILGVHQ